jgi:hypothetical protein
MSHDDNILSRQKKAQGTMFRQAVQRGASLKAIALDSGLGYTTVQSYAKGEAVMSIASMFKLVGVIDDDLMSLLLPDGRQIVQAPEDIDHDALCEIAADYVTEKNKAHHPDSEAGRNLGPNESASLTGKAMRMVGSVAA